AAMQSGQGITQNVRNIQDMKRLIAIIRENQLDQVREALVNAGISRSTVSNVSGHGRTHVEEIYRGQNVVPNLVPNVRVEIALNPATSTIRVSDFSAPGRTDAAESYRGQKFVPKLVPNVRVELALNAAFAKPACDAILTATKAKHDGLIGSGKIFIVPLEECI